MIELHAAPAHFNKHDSGPAAPESVAAILVFAIFCFLLDFSAHRLFPQRLAGTGGDYTVFFSSLVLLY